MDAESLTKENIVFFFNKYKYNTDLIFNLERKLLKESYDFHKWEKSRTENSELTRKLFRENEKLIDEYVNPAIASPEKLNLETLQTFLLHITFFLFENNIDSHLVDDFIESVLKHEELLTRPVFFSAQMNLGISKTISLSDNFENTINCFEKAMTVFPHFIDASNLDTRIHMVFCRVYEMLAFCLYKSSDYKLFLDIYNKTNKMLDEGTPELFAKMWNEESDYSFHIELLKRYFRIYGIFTAGQSYFSTSEDSSEKNVEALDTIKTWLRDEYYLETNEGEVNLMIFTYYNILLERTGEISKEDLFEIFKQKFENLLTLPEIERAPIFPESAFPDDGDPVDPVFSRMLDKMKLFNKTFSYVFIFLHNFLILSQDKQMNKRIIQKMIRIFEKSKYSPKGFTTDRFVFEIFKNVAAKIESEQEFLLFVQAVFVHRQFYTTIHLGMVSSLSGICLYRLSQVKPELFVIPELFPTAKDVNEHIKDALSFIKNAALLHDIGKVGLTTIINLQFRSLNEKEFARLKLHPRYGKMIIKDIPYLERYVDFVEGHHKYWDDKGGYPESFKLQESPYKNYINLLSICDMIDSTTDLKNRNYKNPLTFDQMIDELRKCSGTMYNPELVDLILENKQLLKEIKEITTIGRNYTSFLTYQNFIQPNTSFSVEDEKTIDEIDDYFTENLPRFYEICFPESEEETIVKHLDELLDGKNKRIYILHDSKREIFGILAGHITTPANGDEPYCFIDEILIHPAFRRLGYGTELVNYAAEKINIEGISKMKLMTINNYDIESFFWISGFSQTVRFLMEKDI